MRRGGCGGGGHACRIRLRSPVRLQRVYRGIFQFMVKRFHPGSVSRTLLLHLIFDFLRWSAPARNSKYVRHPRNRPAVPPVPALGGKKWATLNHFRIIIVHHKPQCDLNGNSGKAGCTEPCRGWTVVAFFYGRSDVAFSRSTPYAPADLRTARLVTVPIRVTLRLIADNNYP